jgi:hypothetical protein
MRAPSLYGAIAQNRRNNQILCAHGGDFRANSTGVEEAEDAGGGGGVGASEVGEDGGAGAPLPRLVELTAPLRGRCRRRRSHTSPLSSTSAGSETEGGEGVALPYRGRGRHGRRRSGLGLVARGER